MSFPGPCQIDNALVIPSALKNFQVWDQAVVLQGIIPCLAQYSTAAPFLSAAASCLTRGKNLENYLAKRKIFELRPSRIEECVHIPWISGRTDGDQNCSRCHVKNLLDGKYVHECTATRRAEFRVKVSADKMPGQLPSLGHRQQRR